MPGKRGNNEGSITKRADASKEPVHSKGGDACKGSSGLAWLRGT